MDTERSIILQKKTILFLSLIIAGIFGIIYGREVKLREKEIFLSRLDFVTVNLSEDENEIVRKNIKYLTATVISEDEVTNSFEDEISSLDEIKNDENVANDKLENIFEESAISNEDIDNEANNNVENASQEQTYSNELAEIGTSFVENELKEVISVALVENKTQNNETEIKEETTTPIAEKPKTVRYRDLAENNPPTEYESVVEVSATAYCLCKKCCGKSPDHPYYGYTYSGIKIEPGTGIKVIAVDPKIIPIKSKVYVEGLNGAWDYGHAIAADTGSAIKEMKIDLYMDTHEEALQWGRRKVNVYVLGE